MQRQNASQVGGATFLIGLGIIAFLDYWWPGIMFVAAASLLATEWVETGGALQFKGRVVGAAVLTLIGLVGIIDFNWGRLWPIILILLGLGMLFGRGRRHSMNGEYYEDEKPKKKTVTLDGE